MSASYLVTLGPLHFVTAAFLIFTCAGAFYLAVALLRLLAFANRAIASTDDEFAPSITILKPVAGDEPRLYECLASFCAQDYPDYEVVFCAHAQGDSALPVIERVVADFPQTKTRIAIGHNAAMANPKIANLAKPGAQPHGEIVVIADSDVMVDRTYLRSIAAEFATQATGATTCLYSGLPNATNVSRLGAMHIEDEFAPSVLVALAIGPLRFCLGATMAVRATVLEEIGGLEALGPFLADDHTLGKLVTSKGHGLTLCPYAVATLVPETRLSDLWSHELRWARTHRTHAPAGYLFSFVTFGLPLAVLGVIVSGGAGMTLVLLAVVAALRLGVHFAARRALRMQHASRWWLIPVRDTMSLALWGISLFGRNVRWRDLGATVVADGAIEVHQ